MYTVVRDKYEQAREPAVLIKTTIALRATSISRIDGISKITSKRTTEVGRVSTMTSSVLTPCHVQRFSRISINFLMILDDNCYIIVHK